MKIAIFSDSHDNIPNLEKFLDWSGKNKIEQLIFCGDLCAPAILKEVLGPKFEGKIHMVLGNVGDKELEPQVAAQFSNAMHYGEAGEIEIDDKKIAFTHFPQKAKELAETGKYDMVFYGHTHKPWEEKMGECKIINPGTLAGMFYKATFAVYDTKTNKLELKILERL
jgi:hypothetical protein